MIRTGAGFTLFLRMLILMIGMLLFRGTDSLCLYAAASQAQVESPDGKIRIHSVASPSPASLFSTISLDISIDHTLDLEVLPPEFANELGDFRISRVDFLPLRIEGNRQQQRIRVALLPNRAGNGIVLPIPVRYQQSGKSDLDQSSEFQTIRIPEVQIEVQSSIQQALTLDRMIKRPDPIIFPDTQSYHWIVFALVATALGIGLFHLYYRTRRGRINTVPYSPTQIAMRRLSMLLDSRLHDRDIKLFYIELTAIVRWFIEQKTNIRAPELTTEEFLRAISEMAKQSSKSEEEQHNPFLSNRTRSYLASFMESADLVKFAQFRPKPDEILIGYRKACEFIELGR